MHPKIIAIAGGSGAGKSTVAFALADKYPNKVSILHLDDYHWHGENRVKTPFHEGIQNWDCPESIDWESLLRDLKKLKTGELIILMSKNERLFPRKPTIKNSPSPRKEISIKPKEIIILEGYMSLWNPEVRKLIDYSFYLDAGHDTRVKRRVHFLNLEYEQKVLIPMHEQYVEPTKKFADQVIDVSKIDIDEVRDIIEKSL